jgi:phage tail-like protein
MAQSLINRYSKIATDPLRNFRFYAEFTEASNGTDKAFSTKLTTGWSGGFSYIGGLNISTAPIQYREGGYNTTVHQIPGMTTFSPISLQRGTMVGNDQAITWMRGLFAAAAGEGLPGATATNKGFRVDVKIYVMDHPNAGANPSTTADDNIPVMGFHVQNAWISQLSYSDLNAGSNEILFESMTLVHEGLSVFFTDKTSTTDPYAPKAITA